MEGTASCSGDVFAVDVEMECSALGLAGHAEVEGVCAGGGDGDGVVEIFAGQRPADEIAAAVGGWDGADADAFGWAIEAAAVGVVGVVVAGVRAAEVKIFGLNQAEGSGRSSEGAAC